MNFVAVTACPTGIAHSQMAAENVEQTAESLGHEIKVEVQGAMGAENELTAEDVASADAVIIAADTSVQRDRFEDVPVVKGTVKDGVNDAEGLLQRAVDAAGGESGDDSGSPAGRDGGSQSTSTESDDAPSSATASDESDSPAAEAPRSGSTDDSNDETGQGGLLSRLKQMFS